MNEQKQEKIEREHFDALSWHYDQTYSYNDSFTQYKAERRLTTMLRYILPEETKEIIEIGCGTGEYTRLLAMYYPNSKIYAFDISPNMVKLAQNKCKQFPNISFFVASVYSLPYRHYFDLTCGFYILHHLNVERAIKSIDSTICKDGTISFFEPNLLNPIVYIIKNTPWIKEKLGDTPTEYAINALTVNKCLNGYRKILLKTNEFTPIIKHLPLFIMKRIDRISQTLRVIPLLNYLGGTVEIIYKKRR
jgi:ubiquinone/menaquinone biosynthesis C-methylase UbiE